ncbi:MAG: dihydrofolate reductase family protein [Promethearchaeota archaeon]
MRKIVLYIASSLDGYIARKNGEVDWLDDFNNTGEDYGYYKFYDSIDVTLMGNKTYKTSMSLGDFPYKDKKNYVFTKQNILPQAGYVKFINNNIVSFTKELKTQKGKDIWLIGGTQINELFFNNEIIDELILTVMPVTLGNGIPLFTESVKQLKFKLNSNKSYGNGVVQLHYSILKNI